MAIECKILEEVWTGHSCDYSNLKIFGCEAYAINPKNQHSKLDPREKKCIFVGYVDVTKKCIHSSAKWHCKTHEHESSRKSEEHAQ